MRRLPRPRQHTALARGGTDNSWRERAARDARPGAARALTAELLRIYPELRLSEVLPVVAPACAVALRRPTPGACQTIDAGLATIDVRGPGLVDGRYPVDAVVPELAAAGFGPHDIVALFNGNVPLDRLGGAVRDVFPDYVPHDDDEAIGPVLAGRWRCRLRCCAPLRWKRSFGRCVADLAPRRPPPLRQFSTRSYPRRPGAAPVVWRPGLPPSSRRGCTPVPASSWHEAPRPPPALRGGSRRSGDPTSGVTPRSARRD